MQILGAAELHTIARWTLEDEIKRLIKPVVDKLFPHTYALSFQMNVRELTITMLHGPVLYWSGETKPDGVAKLESFMFNTLSEKRLIGLLTEGFTIMPNSSDCAPRVYTVGAGGHYTPFKLESDKANETQQDVRVKLTRQGVDIETWQYGVKTGHVGISHFDNETLLEGWANPHNLGGDPDVSQELHRYKLPQVQLSEEKANKLAFIHKNFQHDTGKLLEYGRHYNVALEDHDSVFLDLLDTGDFVEVSVVDTKTYYIVHKDAL